MCDTCPCKPTAALVALEHVRGWPGWRERASARNSFCAASSSARRSAMVCSASPSMVDPEANASCLSCAESRPARTRDRTTLCWIQHAPPLRCCSWRAFALEHSARQSSGEAASSARERWAVGTAREGAVLHAVRLSAAYCCWKRCWRSRHRDPPPPRLEGRSCPRPCCGTASGIGHVACGCGRAKGMDIAEPVMAATAAVTVSGGCGRYRVIKLGEVTRLVAFLPAVEAASRGGANRIESTRAFCAAQRPTRRRLNRSPLGAA